MKENDKANRTKYIRALERFFNQCIGLLKRDDFDYILFEKKVLKQYEILCKITPVFLDQPYTKELEKFANEVILKTNHEEKTYHLYLLKQTNQIQKLKNSSKYKKLKHKNSIF